MITYKCDRCKAETDRPREIKILVLDYNPTPMQAMAQFKQGNKYELCWKCIEKLEEWVNVGKQQDKEGEK